MAEIENKNNPVAIYKPGAKGDEVGNIQTALGDYYASIPAKVDNAYGPKTKGAVWNWQTQWNKDNPTDQIKVDGIVGPQTYPRLMQWHANKTAAPVVETPADTTQPVTNADLDAQTAKMNEVLDPTTLKPKTPEVAPAEKPVANKYRFNWGGQGVDLDSIMKGEGKDTPVRQILDDYFRWATENNVPIDYWTVNDIVNKTSDLAETPVNAEDARLKAERKERWDKVGNFLLHLGNVIGNQQGGGYASMKLEDPVQWTERQRLLKEKGLEQRRLNNQSIIQQMHKYQADRRAYELQRAKADEAAAYHQAMVDANKQKTENSKRVAEATANLRNAQEEQTRQLTPVKIETEKSKAVRNLRGGSGRSKGSGKQDSTTTTEYTRDIDGKTKKTVKTTVYGKSGKSGNPGGKKPTGVTWKKSK